MGPPGSSRTSSSGTVNSLRCEFVYSKIPYKGKNKPESQKQANKAHAQLLSPGERANAQLKTQCHFNPLRGLHLTGVG